MSEKLDIEALLEIGDLPGVQGEDMIVYEPLKLSEVTSNPQDRKPDLEDDYSLVRRNLHHQAEMIMDAAKIMLETAKNADSPKHMEVFAQLMGSANNVNNAVLKIHKEMKAITDEKVVASSAPQQISNNFENAQVFIGSPSDLMEEVGDQYEAQEAKEKNERVIEHPDS